MVKTVSNVDKVWEDFTKTISELKQELLSFSDRELMVFYYDTENDEVDHIQFVSKWFHDENCEQPFCALHAYRIPTIPEKEKNIKTISCLLDELDSFENQNLIVFILHIDEKDNEILKTVKALGKEIINGKPVCALYV